MSTHELRTGLTPRDRRALRVVAVAAAVSLFVRFGTLPYLRAEYAVRTELESERDLLARERAILGESSGYGRAFGAARDYLTETAPRLFVGKTEPESRVLFAAYLHRLAEAAGGMFVSQIERLGTDAAAIGHEADAGQTTVRPLALRITGEGDLEGLLTFLRSLEAGQKVVSISDLEIANRSQTTTGAPEDLSFRFRATTLHLVINVAPKDRQSGQAADSMGSKESGLDPEAEP